MAWQSTLIESLISQLWYKSTLFGSRLLGAIAALLLTPFSFLYAWISQSNKRKAQNAQRLLAKLPSDQKTKVIVIGNITAGGTGKTPLLISLCKQLNEQGFNPGIISRGHGGSYLKERPCIATLVTATSDPRRVGDEPGLIAQALAQLSPAIPIAVCPKRQQALDLISSQYSCDIILSDDGLQHYALQRDIEIVLIDTSRKFGNNKLIPAGPLREPVSRLAEANIIVFNGEADSALGQTVSQFNNNNYSIGMAITGLRRLDQQESIYAAIQSATPTNTESMHCENPIAKRLSEYQNLHLVAGIGNPQRFFNGVRSILTNAQDQKTITEHPFADHYRYTVVDLKQLTSEIKSTDEQVSTAIVMTAKDAVKCRGFAAQINVPVFIIDVEAKINPAMIKNITQLLNS